MARPNEASTLTHQREPGGHVGLFEADIGRNLAELQSRQREDRLEDSRGSERVASLRFRAERGRSLAAEQIGEPQCLGCVVRHGRSAVQVHDVDVLRQQPGAGDGALGCQAKPCASTIGARDMTSIVGRPCALPSLSRNPVKMLTGFPTGSPFGKGTKITS